MTPEPDDMIQELTADELAVQSEATLQDILENIRDQVEVSGEELIGNITSSLAIYLIRTHEEQVKWLSDLNAGQLSPINNAIAMFVNLVACEAKRQYPSMKIGGIKVDGL